MKAVLCTLAVFGWAMAHPLDSEASQYSDSRSDSEPPSISIEWLGELAASAPHVLVGRVEGYEYLPGDPSARPRRADLVRFTIAVEKTLRGAPQDQVFVWIGGTEGRDGPLLATENPTPVAGQLGFFFLSTAPGLSERNFIPAGNEWSHLPLSDDDHFRLPTGSTMTRQEVEEFLLGRSMP